MTGPCNVEGCDCGHTIETLRQQNAELREALEIMRQVAGETMDHWDADHDSKVGKLLLAMYGSLKGYRHDLDKAHAALANTKETP